MCQHARVALIALVSLAITISASPQASPAAPPPLPSSLQAVPFPLSGSEQPHVFVPTPTISLPVFPIVDIFGVSALERPTPLCSLGGSKVSDVLALVASILKSERFAVTQMTAASGEIRAIRPSRKGEDRVLIWIERQLLDPTKGFNIFMSTARYEKEWGAPGLQPIRPDEANFSHLREALVTAASKRG